MRVLDTMLRVLAVAGGVLTCYASLFMYEDDERRVQHILEDWWLRIDTLRGHTLRLHESLLSAMASLTQASLGGLFGNKLISLRAIGASACLSLASLLCAELFLVPSYWDGNCPEWLSHILSFSSSVGPPLFSPDVRWQLIFMLLFLLIAIQAGCTTRPSVVTLAAAATVLARAAVLETRWRDGAPILGGAILIGICSDILAITALRALLARQSTTVSAVKRTALFGAHVMVGLVAILVPLGVSRAIQSRVTPQYMNPPWLETLDIAFGLSTLTNLVVVLLSVFFIIALASLIIHSLLWPLLERPIYAVARLGLLRTQVSRTALFALGVATVSTGVNGAGGIVQALRALFAA